MSGPVIPANAGISARKVAAGLAEAPDQVRGDKLSGSS
jgi:hypothetical protein